MTIDRFGTVAILGRSNVGKSTFLNAALGQHLAIVSPRPQTTRDALLGVAEHGNAQIAFIDTPGLHRPKSELGRRMNAAALEAARSADLVLFMTDVTGLRQRFKALQTRQALAGSEPASTDTLLHPEDRLLLSTLAPEQRVVAVINKVDQVGDKGLLLPLVEALDRCRTFAAIVPASVIRSDGVERVLDALAAELPEGPAGYDADTITTQPVAYFAREFVREQVLLQTAAEVPHAVAVSIDQINESPEILIIKATIHVDKLGQRKIVVGRGGSTIRDIGTAARLKIEELAGKKVHLELFVRVSARWKETPRKLAELGYEAAGRAGLPEPFDTKPARRKP